MPRGRKAKKAKKRNDIQVVSLIIASILLAVLIYSNSGWIGENLSPVLGGIMGWIKYIIPIGTFAIAMFLIGNRDKDTFIKKITEYSVMLLCITTIMTVIQISEGNLNINQDFEDIVLQAYNRGTENRGGGAVRSYFCCSIN